RLRRELGARFRALFAEVDALLSPTVPWVAPAEDPALNDEAGAGEMLYSAVYNLVGLPAAGVPCGLSAEGAAVGSQARGARGRGAGVLPRGGGGGARGGRPTPPL